MTTPDEVPPARPAATVVIVRDGADGLEVLLLERSSVGAFAGMWVFPGGRVDDADPGDDELAKARSAAAREAMEEVGLEVDAGQIVPWSHWTPPPVQPKRYTTWFFVAPWTGGTVEVDGHEIVAHAWHAPGAALDAGLPMAPPTYVTLHQLQGYGSVADVERLGPPRGVEYFATKFVRHGDAISLLWHGDAGYDDADPDAPGPRHRASQTGLTVFEYVRTTD